MGWNDMQVKFEEARFKTRKRCNCSGCGKAMSRSTTIVQTVNPPKTRQEVYADCSKEALTWHTKPERCGKCSA